MELHCIYPPWAVKLIIYYHNFHYLHTLSQLVFFYFQLHGACFKVYLHPCAYQVVFDPALIKNLFRIQKIISWRHPALKKSSLRPTGPKLTRSAGRVSLSGFTFSLNPAFAPSFSFP
ncbi:MAG: hypothetical protein AVO34_07885 [Firmicutes bacterium ML8_F2]|nr:MAG: hypothetical protein AVO34_07885 [Firmicutes bacterium ML8_F2]